MILVDDGCRRLQDVTELRLELVATCLQEVTSGGCLQEVACRRLQDVTILIQE